MVGTPRIAAMFALEYIGFNHYVPMEKPILRVALTNNKIPFGMKSDIFDMTFRTFYSNAFTYVDVIKREQNKGELYNLHQSKLSWKVCFWLQNCIAIWT